MSCFVMNPEPLAAIANAVETRLNVGYDYWGFEAPDSLYRELADCKTSCTYFAEPIYRRLYLVNVRAYNGRYASHEEPADEEAPEVDVGKYSVTHRPEYQNRGDGNGTTFAALPWHYQLAKLLDCWLYQTAEDATMNDPLRLAVQEFRDSLYHFIVQHSPEYTAGRWGELPRPDQKEAQSGVEYELINPSDKYTFIAADYETAVLAVFCLGPAYGATPKDGGEEVPIFIFGGAFDWYVEKFGHTPDDGLDEKWQAVADALASMMLGGFEDRQRYELALAAIDDLEKKARFIDEWQDGRSSLNDIGGEAHKLAERLRKRVETA